MAEDQEFEVVEAPPPRCPACDGGRMVWDESIPVEGGCLARCTVCDHLTVVWADEPETEY